MCGIAAQAGNLPPQMIKMFDCYIYVVCEVIHPFPHAIEILLPALVLIFILNRMQERGVCAFSAGRCIPDGIRFQKFKLLQVLIFRVCISINRRGKPLTSLAVIIGLINGTTTETGLKVTAKSDEREYKTGIKISDEEFEKINL